MESDWSLCHFVNCVRQVIDVARRNASHRYAPVLSQKDGVIIGQLRNLLRFKTREAEHSNLIRDMFPVVRVASALDACSELGPHFDDSVSHSFNIDEELCVEVGIVENAFGDACAMRGRVRVHWSDNNFELRLDARCFFGVFAHDGKCARALPIETHVLRKRLGEEDVVSVVQKLADGKGICVDRAGGETLVGHVKVDEEIFVFANLREFLPLLGRGINTSRVVGAGVEEDTSTIGHFVLQVVEASLRIETTGRRIVVAEAVDLITGMHEDRVVISPGRPRKINCLPAREFRQKRGSNPE